MELTQVNNSRQLNVNNLDFQRSQKLENPDSQAIQNKSPLDTIENSHSRQSTFSLNLSSNINSVSNIQIAKNEVSTALNIVSSFEKLITTNQNSLDNIQPQILSFINTFNNTTSGLSENISKIVEERSSEESRVYFDGILGSKPISGQEIYEAISKQKQNLEQFNQQLNNKLTQTENQAKKMFQEERAQFETKIDFKFESTEFKAETVQQQNGSMKQTQANAEPQTSKELLVAS